MIIDHYQISTHYKDYKHITDLNNVTLRGDDVLGFMTKWDDVLMRFDQTQLLIDEQKFAFVKSQNDENLFECIIKNKPSPFKSNHSNLD